MQSYSFLQSVVRDPTPKEVPFGHLSLHDRLDGWLFYQFAVWGIAVSTFFSTPTLVVAWFGLSMIGWGIFTIMGIHLSAFYLPVSFLVYFVGFRYYAEYRLRNSPRD